MSELVPFPESAIHSAFKSQLHKILCTIGVDADTKLLQVNELVERYQKLFRPTIGEHSERRD